MNLGALIPLLKLAQDSGLTKPGVVYAKPSEIYTKESYNGSKSCSRQT